MSAGDDARWMLFSRQSQSFSVAAQNILGVAPAISITRIPGAPSRVLGLVSVRGAVVPLVDPGHGGGAPPGVAVVVKSDGGPLALAADDIVGWVATSDPAQLIDPSKLYRRIRDDVRRRARVSAPDREQE